LMETFEFGEFAGLVRVGRIVRIAVLQADPSDGMAGLGREIAGGLLCQAQCRSSE
jgi:hypothetical protein